MKDTATDVATLKAYANLLRRRYRRSARVLAKLEIALGTLGIRGHQQDAPRLARALLLAAVVRADNTRRGRAVGSPR